jgi:hypothetical protein
MMMTIEGGVAGCTQDTQTASRTYCTYSAYKQSGRLTQNDIQGAAKSPAEYPRMADDQ